MDSELTNIPRKDWIRCLSHIPQDELKVVVERILEHFEVDYRALPQSGLGVLQTKDTAMHEPYFLGEFPMSSSWVVLKDEFGHEFEGAAQVMDDDENFASLLAVCDAVLANNINGASKISDLLEMGQLKFEHEVATRKAMLGSTAVDFSLLGTSEEGTK